MYALSIVITISNLAGNSSFHTKMLKKSYMKKAELRKPLMAPAFDWLRKWIKATDWSMVPKFKFFAGFWYRDSFT